MRAREVVGLLVTRGELEHAQVFPHIYYDFPNSSYKRVHYYIVHRETEPALGETHRKYVNASTRYLTQSDIAILGPYPERNCDLRNEISKHLVPHIPEHTA